MKNSVIIILLSLCTMQSWAKPSCDTLGIDQTNIKNVVVETYTKSNGAKGTKSYAIVCLGGKNYLCTITKTVLNKVALCNKYGCRLALGVVRKNRIPARVVLL